VWIALQCSEAKALSIHGDARGAAWLCERCVARRGLQRRETRRAHAEERIELPEGDMRRLTYYLSGVPEARPLEGWVSQPVTEQADPKITNAWPSASARGLGDGRREWYWTSSSYFKLGPVRERDAGSGGR